VPDEFDDVMTSAHGEPFPARFLMRPIRLVGIVVLLGGVSSLLFLCFSHIQLSNQRRPIENVANRRSLVLQQSSHSYMQPFEEMLEEETYKAPRPSVTTSRCSMLTCFDYSLCEKAFKVYVYPQNSADKKSLMYSKILRALKENKYYTSDPREACLFIPSVDTLDRDKLSPDYVHGLAAKIKSLPLWNGGRNHMIFNIYSGSWPDYSQHLDFDFGEAMLARASVSTGMMRPEFDISIPLIPKSHPEKGGRSGSLSEFGRLFPVKKKYLLAFKGKRYLTGIGSETRNALSLIHDGEEIVLVTTCQHGKGWEKHKDEKCNDDQVKFDSYDYHDLLHKSTFCLVPRGRRLGSFRFLETVEANCIPVSLSNEYALPLAEKIDWSRAILTVDERLLLQLPEIVRSIPAEKILKMRQQLQFLWNAYFSSVDKVVMSVLEVDIHNP
jgi:glucuronyl/N-acetylglucosaminyl transferase EXT1